MFLPIPKDKKKEEVKALIINIYKDPMQTGYLFDTPILYSPRPILREDVPQGWHCCDLCGTAKAPDVPYKLVDQAEKNYAGSILSNQPLKNDKAQSRLLKDAFWLSGEFAALDEFCTEENIPLPQTPIRHLLRPASPEDAGLFYACLDREAQKLTHDIAEEMGGMCFG